MPDVPSLVSSFAQSTPSLLLDELSTLHLLARALHVAAEIGIADHLADVGSPIEDLAERTATDPVALRRLMQFLASYGISEQTGPEAFRATELSDVLRNDHPDSVRPIILRFGPPWWDSVGAMLEAVKTGEPSLPKIAGDKAFDYLARNPEAQSRFDAGIARIADTDDASVAAIYDFSGFRRIVDVGGGQGGLLSHILPRAPNARGVLFDQPQVIANPSRLEESGLLSRCECVAGDFFQAVPADGDCYIIKGVLHDFSDRESVQILRNCRAAVAEDGRVLVAERFVPSSSDGPHSNFLMDLLLMVVHTGRERRDFEFHDLFAAADLRVGGFHRTDARYHVVEGVPV